MPRRIHAAKGEWFSSPWDCYKCLDFKKPKVLLESARSEGEAGRYSILSYDPFLIFSSSQESVFLQYRNKPMHRLKSKNGMAVFQDLMRKFSVKPLGDAFPPFTAGAIGYFSYECKDFFEKRLQSRHLKALEIPQMYFMFCDKAIVWDHKDKKTFWCGYDSVSSGISLKIMREQWEKKIRGAAFLSKVPRSSVKDAPMRVSFSMTRKTFIDSVLKIKEFIARGDIFQANLSHRINFQVKENAEFIYERLRDLNPSSFFGMLQTGDFQIISGSPERLLSLRGREIETRPIAGTRARGGDREADRQLSLELFLSEKERAEHVMLVDLERNDLGRVCEFGSVRVNELMTLENYSHVKHIVSNIQGTLRRDLDAFDALAAFFPGGTITGAPKIRCMQIIDEIENVPRGPYTGSMGYLSFTGDMDLNILIRSLIIKKGQGWLNVGAGIVADSVPIKEYDETLHKAKAVLEAVFGPKRVRSDFKRRGFAV